MSRLYMLGKIHQYLYLIIWSSWYFWLDWYHFPNKEPETQNRYMTCLMHTLPFEAAFNRISSFLGMSIFFLFSHVAIHNDISSWILQLILKTKVKIRAVIHFASLDMDCSVYQQIQIIESSSNAWIIITFRKCQK